MLPFHRASTNADEDGLRVGNHLPGGVHKFLAPRRLRRVVLARDACLHHPSLSLVVFGYRNLTEYLMKILVDTEREFMHDVKEKLYYVALVRRSASFLVAEYVQPACLYGHPVASFC